MRRRTLLFSAAGITATTLAGCLGSDDSEDTPDESSESTDTPAETAEPTANSTETPEPTDTPEPTETATPEPTDTPTETPEPTDTPEDSMPTLEEFAYPAGAEKDGVDGGRLYSTHQSTLTETEVATLDGEINISGQSEDTTRFTNTIGADGILSTKEQDDGPTEIIWSPSSEQVSYAQIQSGSEETYRIDNQALQQNEMAELRQFRGLIRGTEWSDATEVVEVGDSTYAVTYDSVGIADEDELWFSRGKEILEFEATATVTESGYVSEIHYDILTAENGDGQRRRTVSITVDSVGETTVEAPDWVETAQDDGVQFSMTVTDDQTGVELEMVNGTDVPSNANLTLADTQGNSYLSLSEPVSVGDQLYFGLSGDGELLLDTEAVPDGVRKLERSLLVTIRGQGFAYFSQKRRL